MFCGYNNIHYDNVIINYMIEYCGKMTTLSYNEICKSLFNLSKTIIESKENSFAK